jgi:hypothetical protein
MAPAVSAAQLDDLVLDLSVIGPAGGFLDGVDGTLRLL